VNDDFVFLKTFSLFEITSKKEKNAQHKIIKPPARKLSSFINIQKK